MGGEIDSRLHTECAYDVAKLGAEQAIRFVGPVEDPSSLFAAADVHLLTSREEPFGLVMLEVAMFNVPTVCFRGSGGPEEFVDEQCGITVPYLSITGMVSAICDLVDDPLRVAALGRAANEKARRHHDPELSRRRVVGEFARVARPLLQHCDKLN